MIALEKIPCQNNVDLARLLDVDKPSSHKALKYLCDNEYVKKDEVNLTYALTTKGRNYINEQPLKNSRFVGEREFVISRMEKRKPKGTIIGGIISGLTALGLFKTNPAHAALELKHMPIFPTTQSCGSVSAGMTVATSLVSTKTMVAFVVAALVMLGGGIYITEFSMSQNINDAHDLEISPDHSMLLTHQNIRSYFSGLVDHDGNSNNPNVSSTQSTPEIVETAQPVVETAQPVVETAQPVVETAQPVVETAQPVVETAQPVITTFLEGIISTDIAFDSVGNIYLIDRDNHNVSILDEDGTFVRTLTDNSIIHISYDFPDFFNMVSHFSSLFVQYAYAVDEILYCSMSTKKGCLDLDDMGPMQIGDGQFFNPSGIAIDSNDNVYVTDSGNNRIQKFDSSGNFLLKIHPFVPYSSQDSLIYSPSGIAIDSNDNVYVTFPVGHQVQKYDPQGNFAGIFLHSFHDDVSLGYPYGIAIDSNDDVYVTDATNSRIQKFDSSGNFLLKFGSHGDDEGEFYNPYRIAIDINDNVYVTDKSNHRIQKFDSSGNFLLKFGSEGHQNGKFIRPSGIAIDHNGDIYVSEEGHNRVQKISFDKVVDSFSGHLENIKCNPESMINNPPEISPDLKISLSLDKLLSKAIVFTANNQHDQSLLFYFMASYLEPGNPLIWNGIGYAQTFLCESDDVPIETYHHTLKLDPENQNALIGIGYVYEIYKNVEKAISYYELTLAINPKNINALNGLGNTLTLVGDYSNAIDAFKESLIQDNKKIATYMGLAYANFKNENFSIDDGAMHYYKEALKLDSDNRNALLGLLTLYTMNKQETLADDVLSRLSDGAKQNSADLLKEGLWLKTKGYVDEAQELFRAAYVLDPGNTRVQELIE